MSWHLSPASHGLSALVPKKRLLSFPLSNLALGLGLISPSGVSFGIGLSKCPRFAVTHRFRFLLSSPPTVQEIAGSGSTCTTGGRAQAGLAIPTRIISISAHGAGRMLHLALWSTVVFLNLSLFGPNGLPPPCCAPPKIKLVFWGPAAAAKSLQSCPTLCDSIGGSPPGFPVPGFLQARTLEWVAISFCNA